MTTAGVKFVPNPRVMEFLLEANPMEEAMLKRAEASAAIARDIAPEQSGDYKGSIEAESGVVDGSAVGRVIARDFKSNWIEFGTNRWPPHATLRRAAESVGMSIRAGIAARRGGSRRKG